MKRDGRRLPPASGPAAPAPIGALAAASSEVPLDGARFFRRREEKYEIGPAAALFLREEIARRLPLFEFERGEPYTYITTLYFDTKGRDFYHRAERSYDDNVKIRVKEYYYPNGGAGHHRVSPYCYVEIKQSIAGVVVKKRFGCPKVDLSALLRGEDIWPTLKRLTPPDELERLRQIHGELSRYLTMDSVGLTSVVNYRRSVYQESEESLRITFDDQLAVHAPPPGLYESVAALTPEALGPPILKSERVILEIKCPGAFPDWLAKAMQHHSARRLSKFTTSVRLLLESPHGGDNAGGKNRLDEDAGPSPRNRVSGPEPDKDSDTERMTGFLS